MRYYVYLSDAKVEMLWSQIPPPERPEISSDLEINLGVVKFALGRRRKKREPTRYDKLKAIVDRLEDRNLIGTIDEPLPYVRGTLQMRWAPYESAWDEATRTSVEMVYFGGFHVGKRVTVVGLGGSSWNAIGWVRRSHRSRALPDAPAMVPLLQGKGSPDPELAPDLTPDLPDPVGDPSPHRASTVHAILYFLRNDMGLTPEPTNPLETGGSRYTSNKWALEGVVRAASGMDGPPERLEFVARKLLHSDDLPGPAPTVRSARPHDAILLGTPLYVALAD